MCKYNRSPILSSYPTELKSLINTRRKDEAYNFVLAYGPMEHDSPFLNSPSYPVRVQGYKRVFNCKATFMGKKATLLGVEPDQDSCFTGLAIAIKDKACLIKLDHRQNQYKRKLVKKGQVSFLGDDLQDSIMRNSKFWVYVPKNESIANPSQDFPILQSYFDVLVESCIQIGERCGLKNFAQESLSSTDGWLLSFFGQGPKLSWQFDRDDGIQKLKLVKEKDLKNIDEEIMFFVETFILFTDKEREKGEDYFFDK